MPGETDIEATRYFPELPEEEYIVAAPLARGTMGYQGIPEPWRKKVAHQDLIDSFARKLYELSGMPKASQNGKFA